MSAAPDLPEKEKISYNFPKEERLCSKKLITELFARGSSFNLYPLRFVYLSHDEPGPAAPQVLVSVSKKYFKKAVDRNRIKRQLREVYRLHKHRLRGENGYVIRQLALIFIGKEKVAYNLLEKKLNSGLERCVTK